MGKNDAKKISSQTAEDSADELVPENGGSDKLVKDIDMEMEELGTTINGLSKQEASIRLARFGPNKLPEVKENLVLKFLRYFWGPLPVAMEIAAIISICLISYVDFVLILGLLTANAMIGFWEEYNSGSAVAALQSSLAPTCRCYRDGVLEKSFPAIELVPGDIIVLRLGDVVPADCYIIGKDINAKIDQAALTGESLPVSKSEGDEAYSGSAVKQGEFKAVVYGTGQNTLYGNAARLIGEAGHQESHINVIMRTVAWFCISFILVGVILELVIQFGVRAKPCRSVRDCQTINNALVLVVGGIPIAMPTVLSVMQALGAIELSKEGAIVVRLTAVEEMAGMEILCSDKTGTLTLNKLSVEAPLVFNPDETEADVLWIAALASNRENTDAIDSALLATLGPRMAEYEQMKTLFFHPFDPVDKWTYVKLQDPQGRVFHAAKGAPQVILQRSNVNGKLVKKRAERGITDLAKRGYRTIGVAISDEEGINWTMTGLIPLYDPPRHDTKDTIEKTLALGVGVKMITGDQLAIAIETAHLLGMSGNIIPAAALKMSSRRLERLYDMDRAGLVEWADGFAQVLPEDKFMIVESLQADHSIIVGMTGDGVNDAPALKKADIGIAVADATDAARSAADIVLTRPGLAVIVSAILGSRKIFQRMKSYTTYSVSAAVRVVLTFTLLTTVFDFYFPTIAVVFFAILNDGTMITLARDRVQPGEMPEKWNLVQVFSVAIALGLYLTLSTVIYFYLITETQFWSHFGLPPLNNTEPISQSMLRGVIYLQVSISGLSTVFCTRSHKWFWSYRPSWSLLIAFFICQTIASVLGAYGLNNWPMNETPFGGAGWGWVLATWIWVFIWFLLVDPIKRSVNFLSKARIRRTKDYILIPYTLTFKSHGEEVVENQRKSFEETRKSFESTSVSMSDMSGRESMNDPSIERRSTTQERSSARQAYINQASSSSRSSAEEMPTNRPQMIELPRPADYVDQQEHLFD